MGKKKTELSARQKLFAEAYVDCLNKTEAAIKAGYSSKGNCAGATAYRLMRHDGVRDYIDELFQKKHISSKEVISRLASIATGSMEDFLDKDGQIDLDKAKQRNKLHLIKKYKTKKGPAIKGRSPWYEAEIELYPADMALERISKIMGLEKAILEMSGPNGGGIPIVSVQPDMIDSLK